MKILFEDKQIIVCIKPVGVLSQADLSGDSNVISILEEHCGCTVFPLHRLDRGVGGVMVYAKTKTAAAALSTDIAEHRFKKEYIAIVHSKPEQSQGEMRDLLFKDSRKNKSYVVKRKRKGVKEALLEYYLLETFETGGEVYSKVRILLHTGRTHQIRVQFASRKMPLAGDKKYGAVDNFENIGLYSYRISFNHPLTKEAMTFTAEPKFPIK